MLRPDRQSAILKAVADAGSCRIVDLARSLGVSGETVRRDIKLMAHDGLVRKVHGGVGMPDPLHESGFRQRLRENPAAKRAIAVHAAREVANGDSVMLDTGSTTAYVAEALRDHRELMVMTNSIDIAHALATRNGNRVFMAGGELRGDDGAALGSGAVEFIGRFWARVAFLSIGAIDIEDGLMDYLPGRARRLGRARLVGCGRSRHSRPKRAGPSIYPRTRPVPRPGPHRRGADRPLTSASRR